jgi:hypothetical protein
MKGKTVRFEIYEQGKVFVDSAVLIDENKNFVDIEMSISKYFEEKIICKVIGKFTFANFPGIILCDNIGGVGKYTKVVFTEYNGYKVHQSDIVNNIVKVILKNDKN